MIIGIGIDVVEIARIGKAMSGSGLFAEKVFTPAERLAAPKGPGAEQYFAGRWAAKEAAAKALGCGIGEHCSLTDLEILNNEAGAPRLTCSGAAKERLCTLGGGEALVSITHEKEYAAAVVLFQK